MVKGAKNSKWRKYDSLERPCIKEFAGVYAIYINRRLVYIGSSQNVAQRVHFHAMELYNGRPCKEEWPKVETISFKIKYSEKFGDWLMLEARLIKRIKPLMNKKRFDNA